MVNFERTRLEEKLKETCQEPIVRVILNKVSDIPNPITRVEKEEDHNRHHIVFGEQMMINFQQNS